jgi:hypothetical protein
MYLVKKWLCFLLKITRNSNFPQKWNVFCWSTTRFPSDVLAELISSLSVSGPNAEYETMQQ